MWRAFDGGLEAAKGTSLDAECYSGLVNFLRGTERSEPQRSRSALTRGVDRLPSWERELDSPGSSTRSSACSFSSPLEEVADERRSGV